MKQWFIGGFLLVFAVSSAMAEEYKIGAVNVQHALNQSNAGKAAKAKFKVEVDKLQASLAKQKSQIEKIKADVEKKGLVLKDDERAEIEKDYQRRLRDFQRDYKDAQGDLKQKDSEFTAKILQDLAKVIAEYGEKEKFSLVFEASNTGAVLYYSKAVDLTDQIIEAYNKKNARGGS